jgi:hypothetical protein
MTFYSIEVATRINTVTKIFTAMRMRVTNELIRTQQGMQICRKHIGLTLSEYISKLNSVSISRSHVFCFHTDDL